MEWLCGWATINLLIYFSVHVANVFCQNIQVERTSPEVLMQPQIGNCKKEVTQTQCPSKAQLINALFSYATAQGLLPKTTEIIKSTLPQKRPQESVCQNAPKLLDIVPLQPQMSSNCEKKPVITSIPAIPLNPIQNQVTPPTTTYSQAMILQPTLQTESVPWTFPSQTCQGGCFETCVCAQQPQTVWQIPQPSQPITVINNCPSNPPVVFSETPRYANLQISPPTRIVTPINTECSTFKNVLETNCGTLSENSALVTCDGKPGIPINLQINIPSPNDLYPSITIVTGAPTNSDAATAFSPYAYPPPLPNNMMRRSRSCLRKLLPILLLALIDDCGGCGGYSCQCGCDSDDFMPVPYPISFAVNCPLINNV
ncbi:uncharacterized protein LOC123864798 isoform X2 [Maniola jurtina]|uniref:uncharacterized protein LOC123864798 isoform X2 n=1 Tax=Maniola jurtina TaxID=191418 RepID=UPI001E68A5A5|nr:uncharacterized protein LOC123864798 isoform X2 [Maniola jurtina]